MKHPNRFILFSTFCFSLPSIAQQDPSVTMFWNTYMSTNPAVTGLFNQHEANVLYRNQWDKLTGTPNSLFVNYGVQLKAIHSGLGVSLSHDAIGKDINLNRQQLAKLNYALHLPIADSSVLSLGISAGILHFSPNWSNSSLNAWDLNIGLVYHRKKWNVGLSANHLTSPNLAAGGYSYNLALHIYLFGDYTFATRNDFVSISRIQARTDLVKYTVDVSEMLTWREKIWAGINYRTGDALGLMGGYIFRDKLRLGYSYDVIAGKLSSFTHGTHEFALCYYIR